MLPNSRPAWGGLTEPCRPAVLLEWGPTEITQPLPQASETWSVATEMTEHLPGWRVVAEARVAPCRSSPVCSVLPPLHLILQARPPLPLPVPQGAGLVLSGALVAWWAGPVGGRKALPSPGAFPSPAPSTGVGPPPSALIFHVDKLRPQKGPSHILPFLLIWQEKAVLVETEGHTGTCLHPGDFVWG